MKSKLQMDGFYKLAGWQTNWLVSWRVDYQLAS